jgi:hypothetical protein
MGKKQIREKGQALAYDVTSAVSFGIELKAMFTAAGNVLSFALKLVVGVFLMSPLWIANAVYALIPAATRALCVYAEKQPPRVQKRCFRRAGILMLLTAVVFTVVVLLRADEIKEVESFSAPVSALLIAAITVLFIFSLLGLHGSRKSNNRTDYMLRLVSIFSGLSNLLLVQRLALSGFTKARVEYVILVNTWSGVAIGAAMLLISLVVVLKNVMRRGKKTELE